MADIMPQKRGRGRPRKVLGADDAGTMALRQKLAELTAMPTTRLRHKPGVGIQQAWQHPAGIEWRSLPVVAADAPDWEGA